MIPHERLAALVGDRQATRWLEPLEAAAAAAELTTERRRRHFLAQILHESAGLTRTVESLAYSPARLRAVWPARFPTLEAAARTAAGGPRAIAEAVYGGRLGNARPGDGYAYRGRGLIQLTGRANYAALASDTNNPGYLEWPELLEDPEGAAASAAWYWRRRQINAAADADDLVRVTRLVNGGSNGLQARRAWLEAITATSQPLDRSSVRLEPLGALVLHDLSEADHGALQRAWLAGERSVALRGEWTATHSPEAGTPKLDVRREAP